MKHRRRPSNFVRFALNCVGLLLLLATAIYMERPEPRQSADNKCELVERGNTDESAAAYARIAASGFVNLRSRRVTVIPLMEQTEPARVLNNVCEQRWYLSRLVPQLAADGAAAIVIDKFYGPNSCEKNDKGTSDLVLAVQRSTSPVVVGVGSHAPPADPNNACLIANNDFDFGNKLDSNGAPKPEKQPAVEEGLTRLDSDTRKIPLNWFSYANEAAFEKGEAPSDTKLGTLSWVAATLADHDLQNEPRIEQLRSTDQHPFAIFIDPSAFSHVSAASILCASPAKKEIEDRYQIGCSKYPPPTADIRGRVILIGEDLPGRDRHTLLGTDVAGVYLHANYVESLLEGHYLKPFGAGWNYAALALWIVFLYLVFWIQPEVALVISLLTGLLIRYLTIELVLWKGLYPEIWVQELGFAALGLKYVDSRGHKVVDEIMEWWAHNHHQHRKRKLGGHDEAQS